MDIRLLIAETTLIAKQAGEILKQGFGNSMKVFDKDGRHNLVTEYDVKVEQFLLEELQRLTPGASFLGEEGGIREGTSDVTWVVDPLDGTVNFAHGIPIFCVSVGAVIDDELALGVIHHPILDETFAAAKGQGATLNNRPISVSATSELSSALLVTGFPYNVEDNPRNCIEQLSTIVGKGLPIRRLGSAALDLAYTAAGRFDAFWEVQLEPWDMAAGVVILEEAGGKVTHYDGVPFELVTASIVATNGRIHDELVEVLHHAEKRT